jgi:hypothetical protein
LAPHNICSAKVVTVCANETAGPGMYCWHYTLTIRQPCTSHKLPQPHDPRPASMADHTQKHVLSPFPNKGGRGS